MYITVKIIGGPHDGQSKVVEHDLKWLRLPISKPMPVPSFDGPISPIADTIELADYAPEILTTSKRKFTFLRHADLSIEDALDLLFRNYRP
jgi:hypothetical protein